MKFLVYQLGSEIDEITVVMVLDRFESQHWFGGVKRKIESVSASKATVGFNWYMLSIGRELNDTWAEFDARAFSLPFGEVVNNLTWRIQDAECNSVQMLAQAYFSSKELHGVSTKEAQNMLLSKHGVNWNDVSDKFKRGIVILPNGYIIAAPDIRTERSWYTDILFNNCVYME